LGHLQFVKKDSLRFIKRYTLLPLVFSTLSKCKQSTTTLIGVFPPSPGQAFAHEEDNPARSAGLKADIHPQPRWRGA
jgi:hypothetical protein